jgi:hypothetical protein
MMAGISSAGGVSVSWAQIPAVASRASGAGKELEAALAEVQLVQGAEGPALTGQNEDVGGGAFAVPVPGGQPGALGQTGGSGLVPVGQPVVEQSEGDADTARDGGAGVVR